MPIKVTFLAVGFILVAMAFTFAACSASNVVATATPAGVAANATIPGTAAMSVAQCTPTPASPAPTFTLPPNGQYTPGVLNTSIAAYQATYPGGVIDPKQTTDLDPQLPEQDKEHIVIQLAGCTYQTVLLDPSKVANYIKNPPPGVTVIAVAPPFSAFEQQRPNATATLPPGRTPGVAYNASGTPVRAQPSLTVPAPPPPSLLTAAAYQHETFAAGGRAINPTPPGGLATRTNATPVGFTSAVTPTR